MKKVLLASLLCGVLICPLKGFSVLAIDDPFFSNMSWTSFDDQFNEMMGNSKINEDSLNFYISIQFPKQIEEKDIKVSVKNDILSIEVQKSETNEDEQKVGEDKAESKKTNFSYQFSQSFSIEKGLDSEAITAKYQDGILKVTIPKTKEYEEETVIDIN